MSAANASQPSNSALQRGIVKSVLSGDSIIIRGQPKGGPPPEKQINLAFIMAPKLGRKSADGQFTNDEPHAWDSREFLRKKLVGNCVQFKCEYKIQMGNSQREFGFLYCNDEDIVDSVVREGHAEVVRKQQNKDNADYLRLIEMEETSKSAGVGKWSHTPADKREVLQEVEEPARLVNKTFSGIVEHVRDGSTLRVALELEPRKKYQMITLMISGIRCPQTGDSIGDEARFFTESKLLQRDVTVRVEQMSGGGNVSNFVGTVTLGTHNIAEYLVKEGMAKCVDWTLALTPDPAKLRSLEREAKSKRLRMWREYKDPAQSSGSGVTFEAKVLEIHNGDALTVQVNDTQEIKKLFISSIRPPKPENVKADDPPQDRKSFRPLYDVPFMFEAREYLRKRLIGKKVKVSVDYIQPKNERENIKLPEKVCCTIILDGTINIGEALVSRGLASVVRYRPDDEARSACYDALLAAELKAQKSGKGIFSNGKDDGIVRIVDLSTDQSKAKQYLPFLLRTSSARKESLVEYIYSASRIKIYIPKENCLLNLILAGITTPKKDDPYSNEGMSFVKSLIHQKDVQVLIESMDKVGNFIGLVYYDNGAKNLSLEIIKAGFAQIRGQPHNDLINAENDAKKRKIGIWKDYKEEEHQEKTQELIGEDDVNEKETSDLEKRKKIIITNIAPNMSSFHAQFVDDGPKLEELITELREELAQNPPLPGAFQPKKEDIGKLIVAKFSADQQWYRAKIEKLGTRNDVNVIYVDYGNRETVPTKNVAPIPSTKFSSLLPAAKEYTFAFARPSVSDNEMIDDTLSAFTEDTADKVLLMKSEYRDTNNGLEAVTLIDEETKNDIVLNLVKEGFLLTDVKGRRERRLQSIINEYKTAQDTAKKNRANLWRYGDFTEDDAKEFGFPNAS